MKTKSIISVVLSLLLICLFATAAFAVDDENTSTAKIAFTEGDVEFGDAGLDESLKNMNIDFGSNPVPVVTETFTAEAGIYSLRILDPRSGAGKWHITVGMGSFKNNDTGKSTNTFDGTIKLASPSFGSNNGSGNWGTIDDIITIDSGSSDIAVVNANEGLQRGAFDVKWNHNGVTLKITEEEAKKIEIDNEYTAELIWTLIDG